MKLTLNKDALRVLSDAELFLVGGGATENTVTGCTGTECTVSTYPGCACGTQMECSVGCTTQINCETIGCPSMKQDPMTNCDTGS